MKNRCRDNKRFSQHSISISLDQSSSKRGSELSVHPEKLQLCLVSSELARTSQNSNAILGRPSGKSTSLRSFQISWKDQRPNFEAEYVLLMACKNPNAGPSFKRPKIHKSIEYNESGRSQYFQHTPALLERKVPCHAMSYRVWPSSFILS